VTEARPMTRAAVPTAQAEKYLQQLCKHFAHKLEVTVEPGAGQIVFSVGTCDLRATDATLEMTLTAPDANAMVALKEVVARHLQRFAFREPLQVGWAEHA
jgi:hypothetical protein